MAIVRELVTRLGFQVDNTGIRQFNRSILDFKTKFAIAAASFSVAVNKTLDFFNDIATSVSNAQDLSAATGVSVENLIAMGKAAKEFRVSTQSFNSIFSSFNKIVQDARAGSGELFKIARQTGIAFREANGDIRTTSDLFEDVLRFISMIPDEVERVRIAGNIFPGFGNEVARLATNFEKFGKSTLAFSSLGNDIQEQLKTINDYQVAVSQLGTEWEKFSTLVALAVFPFITQALQGLNDMIQRIKELGGGFSGLLKSGSEAVLTFLGFETLPNVSVEEGKKQLEFERNLSSFLRQQQEISRNQSNQVTVTNNFEFDVPPGMPEEQAKMIERTVSDSISEAIDRSFTQILNNNPQVE